MNKQELIGKIIDLPYEAGVVTDTLKINRAGLIKLIDQFDGPKRVTIPQFVADWIEGCKNDDFHLFGAMEEISSNQKQLDYWFREDDNMELFARAWLDGYTVEEEKRYYVRFKFIEDSYSYLTLIKHLNAWTLSSIKLDKKFRSEHTSKELKEAGFGWVFDCPGMEVKEVEEEK